MYGIQLHSFKNDKEIISKNFDLLRGILIQKAINEKCCDVTKQNTRAIAARCRKDLLSYAKLKVLLFPKYGIFKTSTVVSNCYN